MKTGLVSQTFSAGRRAFMKSASIGISMIVVGARFSAKAYAEAKDYLSSRIETVYSQDRIMKFRKSQDNPMVRKLYKEFLDHPMSEKSHELLHARYIDRSAGIKNL